VPLIVLKNQLLSQWFTDELSFSSFAIPYCPVISLMIKMKKEMGFRLI